MAEELIALILRLAAVLLLVAAVQGVQLAERALLDVAGAQSVVLLSADRVVLHARLDAARVLQQRALRRIQHEVRILGEAIRQAVHGTVLVPDQALQENALAQIARFVEELDERGLVRELGHEVLADGTDLQVLHAVVAQLRLAVIQKGKKAEGVLAEDQEARIARLEGRGHVGNRLLKSAHFLLRHVADDGGRLLEVLLE